MYIGESSVKVSNITNGLLMSLILSATAVAGDSKYPATDFQPKVVYQDTEYKHSGSSAASSSKAESSREISAADSDYPAANYQPEVLYQDKNYKHTKDKVTSSSSSSGSSASKSAKVENQAAVADTDESSFSMILGLLVVAVAGFLFYKKGHQPTAPTARRRAPAQPVVVASGDSESLSGVAKYLETKTAPLVSGVAKYLEERESAPVSGVAKYVAKKKVSARITESENVSGVEKYLNDRG